MLSLRDAEAEKRFLVVRATLEVGGYRVLHAERSLASPNAAMRVIPSVWMFDRYLRGFFRLRRRDPQDDLISALIQADEDGESRENIHTVGSRSKT